MPIYEYQCEECSKEFEEIVLGSDDDIPCPHCGSHKTGKLMSRCRHKSGGNGDFGGMPSSGGGSSCSGCSGGSCSTCG